MAVLLGYLKVPLSWKEIFRRTLKEAFWEDNCLGMAAQLAYYFFFALFPALLFLLALASYFPLTTVIDEMFRTLGSFMPPEVLSIITDQIKKISEGEQTGLLTLGMLATLWSSSAAMTAIIDTLNAAYDVQEGRPWWKVRLIAIGLTIGVALFILLSFALVLVGPTMAETIADRSPALGPVFEWTWKIVQWPLVFALASTGIALIYYFAPDVKQGWIWLTPGSVFATTVWLIASLAFKYYVANMGAYVETYGAIGGVMVLLLWFYLSGLAILIGAELNAEIEHASPYGKDEGEKVPGEKRKLGSRVMRRWIAKRQQLGEKPPSAEEVKNAVGATPPDKEPGAPTPKEATGRTLTPASVKGFAPSVAPAQATAIAPTSRKLSILDYLIGAGIVAAQAWFALTVRRKQRT